LDSGSQIVLRDFGETPTAQTAMVAGKKLFIKIPNQKIHFKSAAVLPTRKD